MTTARNVTSRPKSSRPGSNRPGSPRPGSRRSSADGAHDSKSDRRPQFSLPYIQGGRKNVLALLMLAACLVLGGGGTSNPGTEILLELILALLIVGAIWWPRKRRTARTKAAAIQIPRAALAITGLVLLIPVVQLIPLPPAIWHALPGRQSEISALALLGQADRWMPFTLAPASTFASLLAILAELAVFLSLAQIDRSARRMVCWVIVAVAITSIMLGSLQMSFAGGLTWSIYSDANSGWMLGFQANRNAETDILQVAVMALAAIIAGLGNQRDYLRAATLGLLVLVMILLALGAVLTGSRTGVGLLPLTYLFVIWILWPMISRSVPQVAWGRFAAFFVLLLAPSAICVLLARTEQVQHVLERFDQTGEHRWDIWHDTIVAISSVWPLGGGIGSFPVIFDASQSIERLATTLDLRAHNDWLEWILESGVPGIFVLALIGLVLLVCNVCALRQALRGGADADYRATVIFATGTLLHIGLHGIFDYPMRSMSLAALVAAAAAMLMPLRTGTLPPQNAAHFPE